MNLLPMIFAFMVIFGVLALTFIRETKSFHILESSFEGQHRTERRVNNTIVSKAYRKIKSEGTIPSQKQPSLPTKKGVFESRRQFFPPFENSKFNLSKLFESDEDLRRHPLYEPMATLLRLLYEKPLFSKLSRPGIEYQILDALLNKAKTLKSQGADPVPGQAKITEDLSELGPDDPALRPIYYKLLKGTNQYSEKGGYPPLGDYFCIEQGKAADLIEFCVSPTPRSPVWKRDQSIHPRQRRDGMGQRTQIRLFFKRRPTNTPQPIPSQGPRFYAYRAVHRHLEAIRSPL